MEYSKRFLGLQLDFASHIAVITQQPLSSILVEHTLLRHILNLPRPELDSDGIWQGLVLGISESDDPAGYVYECYRQRSASAPDEFDGIQVFGCFYYTYPFRDTPAVRLHFVNRDTSGLGALSSARRVIRHMELRQMFQNIQQSHPGAATVRGGSWLYNLDAYRRLFPPAYIQSAQPVGYETGFFALWGQFLTRDGNVREPAASAFIECVRNRYKVDDCLPCFPYQVLRPECSIAEFYSFYNTEWPENAGSSKSGTSYLRR